MNTQDNSPTKSHDQNFSEEFVRGYFLRGFFGRAESERILGYNIYVDALQSKKIFEDNRITPDEIFKDTTPETVRKLAHDYVDMMVKLYYSGWVMMGNNMYANGDSTRTMSGLKSYLENETEWGEAHINVDTNGREIITGGGVDVFTFLFPPPNIMLGINNDSIKEDRLLDSGVVFCDRRKNEDNKWGFIIRINDEYVVNFNLSMWHLDYGFRPIRWKLIQSDKVKIKDAGFNKGNWGTSPLRIIIEDDSGVNRIPLFPLKTWPIQFCVPPHNTPSGVLKTLNYSRLGFIVD